MSLGLYIEISGVVVDGGEFAGFIADGWAVGVVILHR